MAPTKTNYQAIAVEEGDVAASPVSVSSFKKTALVLSGVSLAVVLLVGGAHTVGFRSAGVANTVDMPGLESPAAPDGYDNEVRTWRAGVAGCGNKVIQEGDNKMDHEFFSTGFGAEGSCSKAFYACVSTAAQVTMRINPLQNDKDPNTCFTTSPVFGTLADFADDVPTQAQKVCLQWGSPDPTKFMGFPKGATTEGLTCDPSVPVVAGDLPCSGQPINRANIPQSNYGFRVDHDTDPEQATSAWSYYYNLPTQDSWIDECFNTIKRCQATCDGSDPDDSACGICLEAEAVHEHLNGPAGKSCEETCEVQTIPTDVNPAPEAR